jgi:hypothetical protein
MNNFFSGWRLALLGLILALIGGALFIHPGRDQQPVPIAGKNVVPAPITITGATAPQPAARRFNIASVRPMQSADATRVLSDEDEPSIPTVSDRPRFIPVKSSGSRHLVESELDPQLQSAASSVRNYRVAFSKNPVGNNREITQTLSGKNSLTARYLPADAPINDKGQLIDRWDQPIFFHQISATVMDVRSAGPDRIMWTADDEVLR